MSQLIQSNIGHSRARNPLGRLTRRATAAPVIVSAAVIALLTCADSPARAAEHPSRMVQEHHACAVVMGLHQPGDLYDTCMRSLSKSLSGLDQARLVQKERTLCSQQGLKPGTSAFAVCAVTAEQ